MLFNTISGSNPPTIAISSFFSDIGIMFHLNPSKTCGFLLVYLGGLTCNRALALKNEWLHPMSA